MSENSILSIFPQELLDDLRQNFTVVREQLSRAETNPFFCGECNSLHRLRIPPPGMSIAEDPRSGKGDSNFIVPLKARRLTDHCEGRGSTPVGGHSSTEKTNRAMNKPPYMTADHQRTAVHSADATRRRAVTTLRGNDDEVPLKEKSPTVVNKVGPRRALPPFAAVAAEFSSHLHNVDKYPLDLVYLCRFALFLTENALLREAYEVSGTGRLQGSAYVTKALCSVVRASSSKRQMRTVL